MPIFKLAPTAILAHALLLVRKSSSRNPPMTFVTDLELEKQAVRGFCLRGYPLVPEAQRPIGCPQNECRGGRASTCRKQIDDHNFGAVYSVKETQELSLRSRKLPRRTVAVAVVAVLNAAWFFTLGCAAFCAFGPCPQHRARFAEERCHHDGQMPQQDHSAPRSPCPDHAYPMACLMPAAAPDVTSGLQHGARTIGVSPPMGGTVARFVLVRDTLSHSPPGLFSGRVLLQKESLLRI